MEREVRFTLFGESYVAYITERSVTVYQSGDYVGHVQWRTAGLTDAQVVRGAVHAMVRLR